MILPEDRSGTLVTEVMAESHIAHPCNGFHHCVELAAAVASMLRLLVSYFSSCERVAAASTILVETHSPVAMASPPQNTSPNQNFSEMHQLQCCCPSIQPPFAQRVQRNWACLAQLLNCDETDIVLDRSPPERGGQNTAACKSLHVQSRVPACGELKFHGTRKSDVWSLTMLRWLVASSDTASLLADTVHSSPRN